MKGGEVLLSEINKSVFMYACLLLFLIFGAQVVFKTIQKRKKFTTLLRSGIRDIDQMDGRQFEFFLEVLFQKLGYKASTTSESHDFGADLRFEGKNKVVIQAKRYGVKNRVGIKAVQEIYAAKAYYGADQAWVISNSTYTSSAKKLAKACGVKLMDRTDLQQFILQVNPEQSAADIRRTVEPAPRKCPECGNSLVVRHYKEQQFLGCLSYPNCEHTEKIAN